MTAQRVRVGDVFTLARRSVAVRPTFEYQEIGVRSFGNGIFHKEPLSGVDLGNKRVFEIHPGDLIVSNVFAWEGAVALADQAEAGMIGSHRFMTWVPDQSRVDAKFTYYYFTSARGIADLLRASPGSAGRNKTLGIAAFENLEIPLPSLDEQRAIAAHLEAVIGSAEAIQAAQASRANALLMIPKLIDEIFRRANLGTVTAASLYEPISDVIQAVDDPGEAKRFVGLENIESHTGIRLGAGTIDGRRGRKLRFSEGDVLFGYLRPYLNKVWAADGPGLCSVEQYVLRPRAGINAALLSAALRSQSTLTQAIDATHHLQLPRLRSGLLAKIRIPDVRAADTSVMDSIVNVTKMSSEVNRLAKAQTELASAFASAARNEVFASL